MSTIHVKYSTSRRTKNRTTRDGGYDYITRRIEREQPDYIALLDMLIDVDATPKSERCNFTTGMREAIADAMSRAEMAALGIAS